MRTQAELPNRQQESKRGGKRKGAGRPAIGDRYTMRLDDQTVETLRQLGGGNLSEGAREAARRLKAPA